MNPQINIFSVLLLTIFVCSIPTLKCKLDEKFKNVMIEFETEKVPFGIIDKFEKFFENVPESPQANTPQSPVITEESTEDDETYSEEYELEDVENPDIELTKYLKSEKELNSADPMNKDYETLVNKLCLLTALSKEATIYATENVRV
jgi:hypothetical protein